MKGEIEITNQSRHASTVKYHNVLVICISVLLLSCSNASYAVFDAAGWAVFGRQLTQMEQKAQQAQQRYEQLQQQYELMKRIKSESEGHYGYGSLMNGPQDLSTREWSPSDWNSALHGMSGGNPQRYQELVKAYQQDHPSVSPSTYQKGASKDKAQVYSQEVQVNRAAMVNATYSFNNIKTHLQSIHALSAKIDQAKNTKAAMDLNSRLIAELAYIQTQELKMQILMNQQMAQSQADTIAQKTQSAQFNTLPTH